MSWFYLALLAPFLYAIVNLVDDNLLQYVYKSPYVATSVGGLLSSTPLVSLIFVHNSGIPLWLGVQAAFAGFLTTLYFFFYFKALESEQPSIVVALFSLVPATLPFLAYFFLDEKLITLQIVGFVIVLLASLGIAATDIKKFKFSKALIPVFIAVGIIDIISLLTKHVYENASFYPAYMCFAAGAGLGGIYFLLVIYFKGIGRNEKLLKISLKKIWPVFIFAEGAYLLAEFTLNLAVSRGPVSIVRVIGGVQSVYVLLIALLLSPFAPKFFREAIQDKSSTPKKVLLMCVTIVGLVIFNVAST